jgi:hypothetical protein
MGSAARSFGEAIGKLDGAARDAQFAQEAADAEQDAAGVVAGDGYGVRGSADAVTFGGAGSAGLISMVWGRGGPAVSQRIPERLSTSSISSVDGLGFGAGESRRRYDRGVGQIQRGGGRHHRGDKRGIASRGTNQIDSILQGRRSVCGGVPGRLIGRAPNADV